MLFGAQRVSRRMHALATLLVALGTTLSAVWILALNSWMHTPQGFVMVAGQAHVTSWLEVIFNPSFPYRLAHMLIASGLTAAFLVAGLSSYRWLAGQRGDDVRVGLRTGVWLAAVLIPLQIAVGDTHGLNTLEHQPAKLAAMEGIWKTEKGAPMVVFGIPDEKARENRFEIAIPKLASLYLKHSLDGEVKGLDDFEKHPPVAPVFFAFRVMVGVGLLMFAVSWLAAWQIRKRGMPGVPVLRVLVAMTFAGWVAVTAGWYVTEIGRQPWLVTGVLTTAEAATTAPSTMIAATLAMYLALYGFLIMAYVSVLFHMARKAGAAKPAPDASPAGTGRLGHA
jgi:cytochrome d ubiquinol oxidase subunit I